ncbi:MAG: GNAT family protein [Marinoscillum sp.]
MSRNFAKVLQAYRDISRGFSEIYAKSSQILFRTSTVRTIFAPKIHQNGLPFFKIFKLNLSQTELAVTNIFNRTQVYNTASSRVLEKCGFTFDANLKKAAIKNGEIVDDLIYSMINPKNR